MRWLIRAATAIALAALTGLLAIAVAALTGLLVPRAYWRRAKGAES